MDNFAFIGIDANQLHLQTNKIAETARAVGLSVHLVTKASSKDEMLGFSFDGVRGRVSVKNCRIWMMKLATEGALHRNTLSGASLRQLVGHIPYVFLSQRPCLSIISGVYALMDAYPRRIARLWSGVRRELRWAASLPPLVFGDLRRPWCNKLFVGDASMSCYGV